MGAFPPPWVTKAALQAWTLYRPQILIAVVVILLTIYFLQAANSGGSSGGGKGKKERFAISLCFDDTVATTAASATSASPALGAPKLLSGPQNEAFIQGCAKLLEQSGHKDVYYDVYAIHRADPAIVTEPGGGAASASSGAASSSSSSSSASACPSMGKMMRKSASQREKEAALLKCFPNIPAHKRELFSATTAGRTSMVRQLHPGLHIDTDPEVVKALEGKIGSVFHLKLKPGGGDHVPDVGVEQVRAALEKGIQKMLHPDQDEAAVGGGSTTLSSSAAS
eukprot:g5889.t1